MPETSPPDARTDTLMVDADVHLSIPMSDLAEYCDEPYRSMTTNPTYTAVNRTGWDRYMGGKIESQKNKVRNAEALDQKVCQEFGIDYPLINAFPMLNSVPEDDRAVHLMSAYNDYVLDHYLDEYSHFQGLASVAVQDPEAAAEELDRIGDENQYVGVYLLDSGTQVPLGDPQYDSIYAAAQDNNLQIAYHASAGAPFARDFPVQDANINNFLENHIISHPWAHMLTATSLIVNGVPEKFPDLNFTFLESGLSWLPYMMFRLNKEVSMRRNEAPLLKKSPEEYIRDCFFVASQPIGEPNKARHLEQIISIIGTNNIMLATDYPHWDFDNPDTIDAQIQSSYPDDEHEKILSGNAIRAFGLDI